MSFQKLMIAVKNGGVSKWSSGAPPGAGGRNQVPRAIGTGMLLAGLLAPSLGRACACGCGIFDVGTSSMFPNTVGGMFFLNYDFQDQYQNWSGTSKAPEANNNDEEIRTHFVTLGMQYMFSRSWGFEAEVPYVNRYFKTLGGASGTDTVSLNWGDLGDIRVRGLYTGFFDDMSTGVSFGLKLPSGNYTYNDAFGDVDRDTEFGTGSTDILLGTYHRHNFQSVDGLGWFGQLEFDLPVFFRDDYRPGLELDGALGLTYHGLSIGSVGISPVAQILGSYRMSDGGANASGGSNNDPAGGVNSGYERLLLAPGVEFDVHPVKVYADVEIPIYQRMTGNQLVAPALFKLTVSYMF
jgi:hypothetical protein